MTTTNPPDAREVDRVADDFITVLAGLELPSQAEPSAAPVKSDLEVPEGREGPTQLCLTQ